MTTFLFRARLLLSSVAVMASAAGMAGHAYAASIALDVVDGQGNPLKDAVVYAMPLHGALPAPRAAEIVIDQVKRQFVPLVSVAQVGTSVRFPNKDNFEHDVYSFSPAKKFELNLYHGTTAKPVVFDKTGLVVMGCSIHDQMLAYLLIVDTPYFAKTDGGGHAVIDNLPADTYKVTAWHYSMPEKDARPAMNLAATDTAKAAPTRFDIMAGTHAHP